MRCARGSLHDVVVDVRPESPTYLRHVSVVLSAENRRSMYVPPMCAHGFQTLEDDTEVLYQIDGLYTPEAARGLRYDDRSLGLTWPLPVSAISERDRTLPLLSQDRLARTAGER